MARSRFVMALGILSSLAVLGLFCYFFPDHYLLISFGFVLFSILPFYIRFEAKNIDTREIVLIAVLAAIAAVSRIPFAPFPSVKPVSFIVIVSSLVFGRETGFIIGSTAALVSNIFFSQGIWTPFQMFGWGMMGYVAGALKDTRWMSWKLGRSIYGFVCGFLFGWIMNLTVILAVLPDFSWQALVTTYMASFYFDLAHGVSNAVFLFLFSASWMKILMRFKRKYGLL